MSDCSACGGTGIGYGKVPGGWMETDCSDCDGSGQASGHESNGPARDDAAIALVRTDPHSYFQG